MRAALDHHLDGAPVLPSRRHQYDETPLKAGAGRTADRPQFHLGRKLADALVAHATPIGVLELCATSAGLSLVAISDHPAVSKVASSPATLTRAAASPHARSILDEVRRQLDRYFEQPETPFSVPIDWSHHSQFQTTVRRAVCDITPGQTATYGEVATQVGHPRAARAVGTAMATNPLLIVVPCHRVVPQTGQLGAYRAGTPVKSSLLSLEGWAPRPTR